MDDDEAYAKFTLIDRDKTRKTTDNVSNLGEVTLKKATTGEIEVYSGTTKVGIYTGGVITISEVDPDLGAVAFVRKKNQHSLLCPWLLTTNA